MTSDRRRFLRLSGLALAGAVAGCSSQSGQQNGGSNGTTGGGGTQTAGETASGGKNGTATGSGNETGTEAGTEATNGQSSGTPGVDQLGGPDDLQSSPTVEAMVLDSDQGAGKYVFSPAVVWVEKGTTITWEIEDASHSVTAYSKATGKPSRIPKGAMPFDSKVRDAGETFEHTFETEGVFDYFCIPHESLGMVGLVVVGSPMGGPGTTKPKNVEASTAKQHLTKLLELAGVSGKSGGAEQTAYGWMDATFDSYWYSLYNMSTNISMSANGVLFPHNADQKKAFEKRLPAMLKAANRKQPPVKNPNLNVAPFTKGDPQFTQKPVLEGSDGRPDASTLEWDTSKSSMVVSPSSLAWTHLKGVTWAKNFEEHADLLPTDLAPLFRAEVLTTLGQLGTKFALADGNLRANDENLQLVSGFRPGDGTITDKMARPHHHSAMLWFLSDLVSLSTGGWFGYENPKPLIPAKKIQMLADGMAKTTMMAFSPEKIVQVESTRELGEMLGAVGWYGTHAGSDEKAKMAAKYANALASTVKSNLADNGMVENGADNQAATQGVVGQGLVWASQIDGVDQQKMAKEVLGYLTETLWDDDAGTYASAEGADTYTVTARDAGDIVGGANAADAVLGMNGIKDQYARFFDQLFNRAPLQRAQRPPSVEEHTKNTVPLPPKAGGEFGQASVYNAEVEYDTGSGKWSVTDDTFDTEQALYLANQDIWISHWGGEFFEGRGVPGKSDAPKS